MYDFEELDYYALLGVTRQATQDEIKRGYRKEIARYHPDRFVSAAPAEQAYAGMRSRRITEAYATLSDFATRTAYNLGRPAPARRAPPHAVRADAVPNAPRDHLAELYDRAQEHRAAERLMQAAAVLRQIQHLNPFYRDTAELLADVEARMQQRATTPARPSMARSPKTPPAPDRRRLLLLLGAAGATAVAALVAWISGIRIPTLNTDAAAEAAPTTRPTGAAATPVAAATTIPPTATTAPTLVPSSTPAPQPTATVLPNTPAVPTQELIVAAPIDESGELLAGGVLASGWAEEQGNGWSVGYQGDSYQISTSPGIGIIWSYRTLTTTQATLAVRLQIEADAGAGLLLRFLDAANYLIFSVTPANGSYLVEQHAGGVVRVLADGRSDAIRTTETNRLVARVDTTTVTVAVNDTLLQQITVSDMPDSPRFGMVAIAGTAASTALFDDLQIRANTPTIQP